LRAAFKIISVEYLDFLPREAKTECATPLTNGTVLRLRVGRR
jgi:hypothetical protein